MASGSNQDSEAIPVKRSKGKRFPWGRANQLVKPVNRVKLAYASWADELTLTVTAPSTGPIGQGVLTTINCSAFASGDYVSVTLTETSSGRDPCDSFFLVDGSGNASGPLGIDQRRGNALTPVLNGCDHGVAVSINLIRWNAAGSIQEFGGAAGFTYDGVSGLHALLGVGGFTPADSSVLNDVLANTQSGAFHSPLLGVMTTTIADGSPFSGGAAIDLVLPSIPLVQVVGLTWQAITIPDVGRGTVGVIEESSRRVMQAVIFHTLASGATFADQVVDARGVTGSVQFDSWNPTDVSLYIWPGFVVDVNFLLAP